MMMFDCLPYLPVNINKKAHKNIQMKSVCIAVWLCLLAFSSATASAAKPQQAVEPDIFDMVDQFDQADKKDLQALLDRANDCTRARNFTCSEEQLRRAAKLANNSRDRQALNSATQNLQAEQQRVREEIARAERERQIQLAEARRREEEDREEARRRRTQQAESSSSGGNAFAQGMQDQMSFYADLNNRHNQHMQNINNIVEQKRAQEEAERRAQERAAVDRREEERANQRAAYDRRMQEQRAADEQRAQNERATREQQAREARAAEEHRAQEAERQRQAQINRNSVPTYTPTVLAQNTGGGAGNKANSASEADGCVLEGTGICRGGAVVERKGGMLYVTQPNHCGYRLYVEICIKTKSGRDDCGSDSAQPGRSTNYWHDSDDATGSYSITAVGVLKGGDDWSCMSKKKRLGGD